MNVIDNLKALIKAKQNGRKIGKLRFKGKNWFKTFTYNQSGFKLISLQHRKKTSNLPRLEKFQPTSMKQEAPYVS